MSEVWDAQTYDSERRRLIHCFDDFYGTVGELVFRFCPPSPKILDLGAGTGLLSSAIAKRCTDATFSVLDESAEMLFKAEQRLMTHKPSVRIQSLEDPLPSGPFNAVVSALAIHHLTDEGKRNLYKRILEVLTPGGIFVNAEQVIGRTPRLQSLNEAVHLQRARELGSSPDEIQRAVARMAHDRCATAEDQVDWLSECGYQDADCIYRSFRFAVIAGWRPEGCDAVKQSPICIQPNE